MVDAIKFNAIKNEPGLTYKDFNPASLDNENVSIFANNNYENPVTEENIALLTEHLDAVDNQQGAISGAWNNFKENVGIGTSSAKCDEAIEKYKNGELTFEEASAEIDKYASKQDSSLNLFSNIATSVAAIGAVAAATVLTGGIGAVAAIAIGAGTGALTKTGFKLSDRATNEVEGDALDAKQIAKDTLSGALTGGLATYTMGTAEVASKVAAETVAGSAVKNGVKTAAINCAKTGVKSGAISGAANYSIDCAFEKNKDFNAGDMIKSTAAGAVIGGTVGGVMGSANGLLRTNGLLNSGCSLDKMLSVNNASVKNVAANSVCTAEYKVLNDRIRAVAA